MKGKVVMNTKWITALRFCSVIVLMSLSLSLLVGCENNDDDDTELIILLDANCSGQVSSLNIWVDGVYWGALQPGQSVSRCISEGLHTLTTDGSTFAPASIFVQGASQQIYDLTCM